MAAFTGTMVLPGTGAAHLVPSCKSRALPLRSKEADPVHKATIVPRGSGILGLVLQHPDDDRYSISQGMGP